MPAYQIAYEAAKDEAHIAEFGSPATLCNHLALTFGPNLPPPTARGLPDQPQPWCGACRDAYSN